MAMSKKGLQAAIYKELTTVPLDTNGVTAAEMKQLPQTDGSVKIEMNLTRGPVYMDKAQALLISKGIAKAVIEHITTSAETSSGATIK